MPDRVPSPQIPQGKTLVTGAAGHVGANLVRHLLAAGVDVRVLVHPQHNNRGVDGLPVERMEGDLQVRLDVDDGRVRYLKAIDGLPFGDSAQQGLVRGRQFFHEGLGIAITAPVGWRVLNGAEAVTVVNEFSGPSPAAWASSPSAPRRKPGMSAGSTCCASCSGASASCGGTSGNQTRCQTRGDGGGSAARAGAEV